MTDQNILISFASEEQVDDAYLILEQEEYPEVDQLTMLGVARILSGVVSSLASATYSNDCIMSADGKRFTTSVLAYPYPMGLIYNVGVVNGSASTSGGTFVTKTETLKFSLDNAATLKYPIHTFVSGEWMGDVYLTDGTIIPTPSITRVGQELRVDLDIWGTYEVTYTTWVETHIVSVSARDEAVENFFQSVFYASFEYGIELLNLEPPPNAEENYLNGVDCNGYPIGWDYDGGSDLIVVPPEDGTGVPTAEPVNETITLNYCVDFGNE